MRKTQIPRQAQAKTDDARADKAADTSRPELAEPYEAPAIASSSIFHSVVLATFNPELCGGGY